VYLIETAFISSPKQGFIIKISFTGGLLVMLSF